MPRNRDGPKSAVNHVVVTGYEKRRQPSKHYVFAIDVTWDNDERFEVLRRYSEFFTLQETLKLVFPDRAHHRQSEKHQASLPPLPKRKFLGRSHVESVAEARLEALNMYCQSIIRMDETVSRSKHVLGFFLPKIGDRKQPKLRLNRPASLHPQKRPEGNSLWEEYCVIADFKGEKNNQITADSGDQVIVLNKDSSGWSLIERKGKIGWIPESYLKKTKTDIEECLGMIGPAEGFTKKESSSSSSATSPSLEIEAQEYMAIDSYEAQGPGQINFEEGEIITVLDKLEDGWWFVTKEGEEGWVPCGYLDPLDSKAEEEIAVSSLDIERYQTVAPYTAVEDDEISFAQSLTVEVLQKSLTGWWLIRCEGNVGLAPATYLKKIEEVSEEAVVDSGIESGSEKQDSPVIFTQAPRQKTIKKKRSTKKGEGKKKETATPERTRSSNSESYSLSAKPKSPQMRKISDPVLKPRSPIAERKISQPDPPTQWPPKPTSPKPPRIKSTSLSQDYTSNKLEAPYTPPRPRQSQINRAWKGTDLRATSVEDNRLFSPPSIDEEIDEVEGEGKRKRGFSPSRLFGRRSPSPRSPRSPQDSPRTSPFQRRRDNSKSLSPPSADQCYRSSSNSDSSPWVGGGGANPFTQTMVDSMLKYILASEDEGLKAALKDAIRSDKRMMEELRK